MIKMTDKLNKECKVCFGDTSKTMASFDELADSKGLLRSSMLRLVIREKLAADTADSK